MPTAPLESDFSRGMRVASGFLNPAVQDIQTAIDRSKMDKVANQLLSQQLNTDTPPRAAMVGWGKNPQTGEWNQPIAGLNTQGTAPRVGTGGLSELSLRNKIAEQNIINQLRQAQSLEASAKAQAYLNPQPKQITPYEAEMIKYREQEKQRQLDEAKAKQTAAEQAKIAKSTLDWQNKNAQTLETLTKEFNNLHGSDKLRNAASEFFNAAATGTLHRVSPNPQAGKMDPTGKYVQGNWIDDPNGQYYHYKSADLIDDSTDAQPIKMTEMQSFLDRKAAIDAAGGRLLPTPHAAAVLDAQGNPVIGKQATVQQPNQTNQPNLPAPSTKEEYDAIPSGSQFIDGDGQTKVKP
jgi:hypothetical protein